MFIQTEATPNPATVKFLPGRDVLPSGSVHFAAAAQAGASPLGRRLFDVAGVDEVFFGADFVSVTKAKNFDWRLLKPQILGALMEHFTSGQPVMEAGTAGDGAAVEMFDPADAEIVTEIKALIDARVRPAVAQDGGDIVFRAFDKGVVYLTMQGACSGCPSASATLKSGVENMLKHYIPQVLEVRAAR